MAVNPESALRQSEPTGSPVEMLVVGCPLGVADGYANALRNQDQAAHLKIAPDLASLNQQLSHNPCRLVILNADTLPCRAAIENIRATVHDASILLVGKDKDVLRPLAIEYRLQDLVDIRDAEHLALAVKREHRSLMLRRQLARVEKQLQEAEARSHQLVHSSRDAIAYIHEGMYLNANQTYLDMFGHESADEIDGLPIMDMIEADSRGDFKIALRLLKQNGSHDQEVRCITSDGESFSALMEFSPAVIDGEHCTQVMIRDQGKNAALEQQIEELTSKDPQTGFFNRRAFMDRLESLVVSAAGRERDHALVQMSISNYADMRESCGFECAEQMLTEMASVVTATAARAHTIARFGDHDFMVLCDDEEPALEIAERCLHNLRGHAFKSIRDSVVQPVYSIGVTRADKGSEISAHELINRSCRATGMARAEGDNRVVFYSEEIPGDTNHLPAADAEIVRQIDHALENDGFRLKFQPIVSLQGDTRENYSVYLRMIGDKGEEIAPDAFLSPTRDPARLAEVDRWVVRNAIRELASHRRNGKKIIFHIILSRAGIEDDSMLLWICDCLREFRAKGAWLVFQFDERDVRRSWKPAMALIDGLKKINCRIAVSNFVGSETSDGLLRHLSIDIVKLSPEFMRDLATDQAQQDRMNATNAKLQKNEYKTVASGVEDAASLAILWNVGVNYIQGYFLQEPSNTITFDEDR